MLCDVPGLRRWNRAGVAPAEYQHRYPHTGQGAAPVNLLEELNVLDQRARRNDGAAVLGVPAQKFRIARLARQESARGFSAAPLFGDRFEHLLHEPRRMALR